MIKEVIINLEVVDGEEDGYCFSSHHSRSTVKILCV